MITPEQLAKNGTEDCHQAALFCWASLPETQQRYPELAKLFFAIPNGGERNKIVAAKLKATGVKSGVTDLLLAVPRKLYHGLFIELKKIGGRPEKDQVAFIEAVRAQGYAACICEGWMSAKDAVVSYLDQ